MAKTDQRPTNATGKEVILRGLTISPGIGIGAIQRLDREIVFARDLVEPDRVRPEQERYRHAVKTLGERMHQHIEQYHAQPTSQASTILRAHQMMLQDEDLHERVLQRIATEHKNAEWALEEEGKSIIREFAKMRTPYLQARAEDVRDLVDHVSQVLSNKDPSLGAGSPPAVGERVLTSTHLYPSDVVLAERSNATAFVTESRALSSHAAILLRGFGITAVGAIPGLSQAAHEGDTVIVNATEGTVILNPTPATLETFIQRRFKSQAAPARAHPVEGTTKDGSRVQLLANIENPHQALLAFQSGLEGIGLFRTEFLVLLNDTFPTEDEQYAIYREVLEAAQGLAVTIRVFDIGADKQAPIFVRCTGQNPALGVRGIRRHLLRYPEELRTQIRAILRAAQRGTARILLPMVTTVNDIMEAKRHFETVKADLQAEGTAFNENAKLGAMIEVPAAAISISAILDEVDFVSVGTNDLLQYVMGADRDNEDVLHYNDPEHGAFQWLLQFIIEQAKARRRENDVTICGEMASRPDLVPALLQLGYRSFSIAPVVAEAVREAVRNTEARGTDQECLVFNAGEPARSPATTTGINHSDNSAPESKE